MKLLIQSQSKRGAEETKQSYKNLYGYKNFKIVRKVVNPNIGKVWALYGKK